LFSQWRCGLLQALQPSHWELPSGYANVVNAGDVHDVSLLTAGGGADDVNVNVNRGFI